MTSDVINTPADVEPLLDGRAGRTFFGQPPALGFLAFTEAWERFSYYGMTSILVLYMSQALFLPGRVEEIGGFAGFRAGLEAVFGPMTTIALASQVYGLYTAFVYFTPVIGGWVADRFIGRKLAVMIGAVTMSAGHLAMAFDGSFLLALLLLIVGCGLIKGNISAQVGTLYPLADKEGRTRGFAIFSMGINVGAIVGPLVIGALGEKVGWHVGFGIAGALMLLGLVTYIAGYKLIPDDARVRSTAIERRPLDRADWQVIGALAVVIVLTVFQSIAYYQNSNIALIWIDAHVDLNFLGFIVPTSWFNSIDPFASIAFVPPLFAWWNWQAKRGREPDEIGKIGQGALIAAAANLMLAIACIGGGRTNVIFPVVYDVLLGIAFLFYWPTLLALVSRTAPMPVNATMMGTAFLSLFLGNFILGWLGRFYEMMPAAGFWALHAVIAAAGWVLVLLLGRPLRRVLDRRSAD